MKQGIHPQWHDEAMITCSCGNIFKIGATKPELSVEVCSKCHPFYTGDTMRFVKQGKIDKFRDSVKKAEANKEVLAKKKAKKQAKEQEETTGPKSLKEMLLGQ